MNEIKKQDKQSIIEKNEKYREILERERTNNDWRFKYKQGKIERERSKISRLSNII